MFHVTISFREGAQVDLHLEKNVPTTPLSRVPDFAMLVCGNNLDN